MIPIFIISYNRYTVLKRLVDRLSELGQEKIVIIDNKSTYGPLLKYYTEIKDSFDIIYMKGNDGHKVITNLYLDLDFRNRYQLEKINFMYTDCDVVPAEECPADFVEKFDEVLKKYKVEKVGFGLRIDDLPDLFEGKQIVVNWELQFWRSKIRDEDIGIDLYPAAIDTTFSYRRASTVPGWTNNSYRTGTPYVAKHLPWYVDTKNLLEEDQYYIDIIKQSSRGGSSWVSYSK